MTQDIQDLFAEISGCQHCRSEWFEYIDQLLPSETLSSARSVWEVLKAERIPAASWREKIIDICCPHCNSSLSLGDKIYDDKDDLFNELVERISNHLSEDIVSCDHCNDDEILYEYRHGNPDNLREGNELCRDRGVPDDLSEVVSERLRCRCGENVGTYGAYQTKEHVSRWFSDYDEIAEVIVKTFDISRDEAEEFTEHLMSYPMLGITHPIGQKIYEQIRSRSVPGITKMEQGEITYRARYRNNISRKVTYVADEMWAPPLGISSHGRYNPTGVSVLYLTNSKEAALKEIGLRNGKYDVADIAEIILLNDVTLWDVRELDLQDLVDMPSINTGAITREYVFPNFLAQCCAAAGIDGLQYSSVKDRQAWNLAMFHYKEEQSLIINHIFENEKMGMESAKRASPPELDF